MNNKYLGFALGLILCIHSSLTIAQTLNTNLVNNQADGLKSLSQGSEQFALDLFRRISVAVHPHGYDFMISPFSIWSLLILLVEGAQGNTLTELQHALRLNQDISRLRDAYQQVQRALTVNTTTIQVSSVQAVFSDLKRPAEPQYTNILQGVYKSEIIPVDFIDVNAAQNVINNYVSKVTRGGIDYVVNAEDLIQAHMVLISAIFFKGQWKSPFNTTLTKKELFYGEDEQPTGNVNMMFQYGQFPSVAIAALDSHVLELPYGKENRLSMIILLPKKGTLLTTVIGKLASYGTAAIINELQKYAEYEDEIDEVEVHLPRFTTTSDFALNVILEEMGILDLFDDNKADLSKISTYKLFVSRLFHKTRIEVNEEGTVASAATGAILINKATPARFYLNRPFAYLIVEKSTNSLLFCGQVRNPDKV